MKPSTWALIALGVIVLVVAVYAFATWMLQLAWNALVPPVFHGPHLTFREALAAVILLTVIGNLFRGNSPNSGKS